MILKLSSTCVLLISVGLINGCAPVMFMGATTGVATSVAEERGIGGVISDTEIKARIFSLYAESDLPLNSNVEVVVRQGKVLLTGIVDTPKVQIEAVRLAWMAKGVKEVHDELQIGQNRGLGTLTKDSWISTQLRTRLLLDEKVSSINYTLHTIEGVVYVMGIAKSQEELDHVINLIRNTSGVKQVISYVHVRTVVSYETGRAASSRVNNAASEDSASFHPSDSFAGSANEQTSSPNSLSQPNTESAFD